MSNTEPIRRVKRKRDGVAERLFTENCRWVADLVCRSYGLSVNKMTYEEYDSITPFCMTMFLIQKNLGPNIRYGSLDYMFGIRERVFNLTYFMALRYWELDEKFRNISNSIDATIKVRLSNIKYKEAA